ncbi:MAG: hypothetical protein AAF662_00015 [Pseudomonadota bacterium]
MRVLLCVDEDTIERIVRLSMCDIEFRKQLLQQPKQAIAEYLDLEVPETLSINVQELPDWGSEAASKECSDFTVYIPPLDTYKDHQNRTNYLDERIDRFVMCTTSAPGATCWIPTVNSPTCGGCGTCGF